MVASAAAHGHGRDERLPAVGRALKDFTIHYGAGTGVSAALGVMHFTPHHQTTTQLAEFGLWPFGAALAAQCLYGATTRLILPGGSAAIGAVVGYVGKIWDEKRRERHPGPEPEDGPEPDHRSRARRDGSVEIQYFEADIRYQERSGEPAQRPDGGYGDGPDARG
ncbi:hypothetical protein [Nocardia niwae]|uniref:hypothetical protein n=1 Tax=Nocardia niwae TaxID=626084 RepID=UPI0033E2B7D0